MTGLRSYRFATAVIVFGLLGAPVAQAENQMGYRLLTTQQASQLPRGGGSLGLDVSRGQVIQDSGISFELLKVRNTRPGSPADRAGLSIGDQVIAVDGRVFPSIKAFASYVGSFPAGRTLAIDYIPRGGGPEQAQRIAVMLAPGGGRASASKAPVEPESHGMSTGQKLAIGAGAVALFGCYKMGCFNRRGATQPSGVTR